MTQSINLSKLEAMILSIILLLVVGMVNQYANVNIKIDDITRLSNMLETEVNSTFYGLQKTVSYVITRLGAYTCMQNGTTGKLDFYSTNASAVINNAIGNLTSGRTWQETVQLKGRFVISDTVLLSPYTDLAVQGQLELGFNGDMFRNKNYDVSDDYHITIRGVSRYSIIDGKKASFTGSCINGNFMRSEFRNLLIKDFATDGIYIWGKTAVLGDVITFNRIIDCNRHGINFGANSADHFVLHNYVGGNTEIQIRVNGNNYDISHNHLFGQNSSLNKGIVILYATGTEGIFRIIGNEIEHIRTIAIHIVPPEGADFRNSIIADNTIRECGMFADNTYDVISLDASAGSIENNVISGNRIWTTEANKYRYALYGVQAGADYVRYNRITENLFAVGGTTPSVSMPANNKIYGNDGFVTENSGTATNTTATTSVFNHGLAGTPTFVSASFNSTAITGWKWTATSTQITITVNPATKFTVYWYAEYKP